MRPGEPFDFDVYLSFKNKYNFFKDKIATDPFWSEKNFTYNYTAENERHFNLTLPVHERIRMNKTLYLHMQITTPNPFYNPFFNYSAYDENEERSLSEVHTPMLRIKPQPQFLKFNETLPVISYMPKQKDKQLKNLFDTSGVPEVSQK